MEILIDKFDDLGNGICKINEKICFVNKGIPGEVVSLKLIKSNKKYQVAEIEKIIKKSNFRIKPICKYYNKCGGCNFLHLNKSLEKDFKINKAKNWFLKCDNFYETKQFNYRNKVKLHVKNGLIGFYKNKTHDLIEITNCYLVNNNINKVIKILNNYKDLSFNGEIIIRENYNKEIILVIIGNYRYLDNLIKEEIINNIIYNDKVIKGNDYFYEKVLDYKFKVSYNSFFQVNRKGLENIYFVLSNFLCNKNINIALDLYSGTSVLGIHLARYIKKVISVEVNSSATKDALVNKDLNNISNLEIINDKVENVIDSFSNIDLIVIDPARSGLDKKTLIYLKEINPKYIIYIACSLDSLKRDLKDIIDLYNLENLFLIDMFPRTNNVECVSILNRKNIE